MDTPGKDYEKHISTFWIISWGVSREGVSIENPKEVKFAYDKTERILRAQAKEDFNNCQ